jgi:YesN/AraC family two-component response regulator
VDHPLTVLIVDDEVPIREELKAFNWEDGHAVLVGEARNGEEALQLCRFYTPDVVITDISMPVMDGLALFRALKQELPAAKVILLTCHSDFQYAQEALQLGAVDYMLKVTMTDRQLQQALEKARDAIEKEASHRGHLQYRLQYEQARQFRHWLNRSQDERGMASLKQAETGLGLSWRYPVQVTMLHTVGHEQDLLFTDMETVGFTNNLLKVGSLEGTALPYGTGKCLIVRELKHDADWFSDAEDAGDAEYAEYAGSDNQGRQSETSGMSWVDGTGRAAYRQIDHATCRQTDHETYREAELGANWEATEQMEWTTRLVLSTYDRLSAKFPFLRHEIRLFAIRSGIIENEQQLIKALQRLEADSFFSFYEPDQLVFTSESDIQQQQPAMVGKDLDMAVRKAMRNSQSLILFIRSELTEWAYTNRPEPDKLKSWVIAWRKEWYPHRDETELKAVEQRILLADSLADMVEELLDEANSEPAHKLRYEVAQAKQLIADKLAEDITVAHIAEQVGLRDHYFSRVFRQETGEAFNEYVMRLRMDKAVLLLTTTSLKVYEIAEQVGIPNYRYFYVLFRKWTGFTPTDYKKG